MPDPRYCRGRLFGNGVFHRDDGTKPVERTTIRERVYSSSGWKVVGGLSLPFQMNIRLRGRRGTRIPLIARYLPQPIDKRHKIGRMILSGKSGNSNRPVLPSSRSLHPNANV